MRKIFLFAALLLIFGTILCAQESSAGEAPAQTTSVWKYFAAALAVGFSCIAGGIAVAQIGSAAMGALSENPEISGKALLYVGLAEGICLWGFLVAMLVLFL
ncbi:MAG: ATP synthase subunit C [Spirochaetaceae bacterium]|jgi:V/A-type H+-transporting ATPase subunit K|nr:ATP synthase subunit C [Spirochaetaceae bacterium]